MPKRVRNEDIVETDRIAGQPHPRETLSLIGHEDALTRAARAVRGGRPPQAWLIAGPPGIGKATLAYRIARYLLCYGADDRGPEGKAGPTSSHISRSAVLPLACASPSGRKMKLRAHSSATASLTSISVP